MRFIPIALIIFTFFIACEKDENKPVTIHCDGLITDTLGTGDNGRVYMPNAFTPNSDGINDVIRPLTQNISSLQFSVYDENSNIVFTSSTLGQAWITTISPNTSAKYYFRIQAITNSNRKIGFCGDLYKLSCFPSSISRSMLFFEDQLTPFGFTGVTNEQMGNCP